jgi:hypothetical protein
MMGTLSKDGALDKQSPGKAFGSPSPVANACLVVDGEWRWTVSSTGPARTIRFLHHVCVRSADE